MTDYLRSRREIPGDRLESAHMSGNISQGSGPQSYPILGAWTQKWVGAGPTIIHFLFSGSRRQSEALVLGCEDST